MKFIDLGEISYQKALEKQLELLEKVSEGAEETIIFCSHPPVVTLGRSTQDGDVTSWTGDVIEIQRGGRATYHGPSQLVIYPILNLSKRGRDLHLYLRSLESVIVEVLKKYGLKPDTIKDATGVWVDNKKVASIGVGVKKWVTYHGLALNVDYDSEAFKGLNPCGFTTDTMVSLEKLLSKKIDRIELSNYFRKQFLLLFNANSELSNTI